MKTWLIRSLLGLVLAVSASPTLAADSYLYVDHGRSITNGTAVNVKALKRRHAGSFFWFLIDGKAYIARDPRVLSEMKAIYQPLFDTGADFTIGEQGSMLGRQARVEEELKTIGFEPRTGEGAAVAARRRELKQEQVSLRARQNELARRANVGAEKANEYAANLDALNRSIEQKLHALGVRLVQEGIAVEVRN